MEFSEFKKANFPFRRLRKKFSKIHEKSIIPQMEFRSSKKANFPFRKLCRTISLPMQRRMHTEFQMVRSTLRIRAQMWKVARPDRDFQNRPKSLMSDTFLLLDFFPVMNFHLEEVKGEVWHNSGVQIFQTRKEIPKGKSEVASPWRPKF